MKQVVLRSFSQLHFIFLNGSKLYQLLNTYTLTTQERMCCLFVLLVFLIIIFFLSGILSFFVLLLVCFGNALRFCCCSFRFVVYICMVCLFLFCFVFVLFCFCFVLFTAVSSHCEICQMFFHSFYVSCTGVSEINSLT